MVSPSTETTLIAITRIPTVLTTRTTYRIDSEHVFYLLRKSFEPQFCSISQICRALLPKCGGHFLFILFMDEMQLGLSSLAHGAYYDFEGLYGSSPGLARSLLTRLYSHQVQTCQMMRLIVNNRQNAPVFRG